MPRNKYPEQTVEKILSAAERLFAQKGYAIVLISSEMPEVLAMSDRIGVMHEGKLVKILNRDEATQEKLLAYAMNSADTMLKEETGRE